MTSAVVAAAPQQQPAAPPKAPPSLYIALENITPSKTNPRTLFDKGKLADLAASIAKHGILEPLLVRKLPGARIAEGMHEIVAGERRYRAAVMAGLQEVPCIVRTLTDEEALEIQVIENVQRDDLHPMEEAVGYGDLVRLFHHTQEDIAARVGKSPAYIAQRMKLLDLSAPARKLFMDGQLTASTALIIARIPVADLHIKAAKEITERDGMTTAAARDWVQRLYMLDLKSAPFDVKDAELNNAGPCGTCPKRTGNQAALFADITKGDLCTDPACFRGKAVAHGQRLVAAAEKSGQRVIKGKEAKAVMPYHNHVTGSFVEFTQKCWDDPKSRTAAQIVGKDYQPVLLLNPHEPGLVTQLVPKADIAKALTAQGVASPALSRGKSDSEKAKERAAKVETAARRQIFTAVREKFAGEPTHEDLVAITSDAWRWAPSDSKASVAQLWSPHDQTSKRTEWVHIKAVDDRIPAMDDRELYRLLMDLVLGSDLSVNAYSSIKSTGPLFDLAKRYEIDVAKIRREAAAMLAPKKPAKKKAKKKKAPAAAKKTKPKATKDKAAIPN